MLCPSLPQMPAFRGKMMLAFGGTEWVHQLCHRRTLAPAYCLKQLWQWYFLAGKKLIRRWDHFTYSWNDPEFQQMFQGNAYLVLFHYPITVLQLSQALLYNNYEELCPNWQLKCTLFSSIWGKFGGNYRPSFCVKSWNETITTVEKTLMKRHRQTPFCEMLT